MHFGHRCHAANAWLFGIAPEFRDREMRELWRELARPVTFFDLCSPRDSLAGETCEFFREKRARQDSNLRPPA